jgi:hypothetical protein
VPQHVKVQCKLGTGCLIEIWSGLLHSDSDYIENLPFYFFNLCLRFALIGIQILGFPLINNGFCFISGAVPENRFDIGTCFIDGGSKGWHHLGQIKPIILIV